jgi:hypothetical protein
MKSFGVSAKANVISSLALQTLFFDGIGVYVYERR